MKRVHFLTSLSALLLIVATVALLAVATPSTGIDSASVQPSLAIPHPFLQQKPARKINLQTLEKYVARYALDAGIIPVSTLDVSLENGELSLKPSVLPRRKLAQKSANVFVDEIEGSEIVFNQGKDGKIASLTFTYEGERYTAVRVLLPAPSLKGNTTFRLKGFKGAKIIALAGSFNTWNQSQYIFGREGGEWICRLDLPPGKHTYKFIVDGNWLLDPANPNTEDDDYGVKNSVLTINK